MHNRGIGWDITKGILRIKRQNIHNKGIGWDITKGILRIKRQNIHNRGWYLGKIFSTYLKAHNVPSHPSKKQNKTPSITYKAWIIYFILFIFPKNKNSFPLVLKLLKVVCFLLVNFFHIWWDRNVNAKILYLLIFPQKEKTKKLLPLVMYKALTFSLVMYGIWNATIVRNIRILLL